MKGFQGISLYLLKESDYTKLLAIPVEFWEWLVQNDWLVSFNSFGDILGALESSFKKTAIAENDCFSPWTSWKADRNSLE